MKWAAADGGASSSKGAAGCKLQVLTTTNTPDSPQDTGNAGG